MSSLLIGEAAFLVLIVVASALFYRRIKQAQEAYEESREVTKSIVVSFLKELSRVKERLGHLEGEISGAVGKSNEALVVSVGVREEMKRLLGTVEKTAQELEGIRKQIEGLTRRREIRKERIERVSTPIPIGEEGVLNKLNPTELRVLEIFKEEGEMTAPKIRERIGKTREHTARLLKKLYERGFIDRNARSMPYKYRIRKELRELLEDRKRKVVKKELSQ